MIIPSWLTKLIAPFGIALGLILAIFGYGKVKEAEGKQELKDEQGKQELKNIKRAVEITREVENKTESELDANARDNGWM